MAKVFDRVLDSSVGLLGKATNQGSLGCDIVDARLGRTLTSSYPLPYSTYDARGLCEDLVLRQLAVCHESIDHPME